MLEKARGNQKSLSIEESDLVYYDFNVEGPVPRSYQDIHWLSVATKLQAQDLVNAQEGI
jgi:hypothetical protein